MDDQLIDVATTQSVFVRKSVIVIIQLIHARILDSYTCVKNWILSRQNGSFINSQFAIHSYVRIAFLIT